MKGAESSAPLFYLCLLLFLLCGTPKNAPRAERGSAESERSFAVSPDAETACETGIITVSIFKVRSSKAPLKSPHNRAEPLFLRVAIIPPKNAADPSEKSESGVKNLCGYSKARATAQKSNIKASITASASTAPNREERKTDLILDE